MVEMHAEGAARSCCGGDVADEVRATTKKEGSVSHSG